jgi:hypothetical protein
LGTNKKRRIIGKVARSASIEQGKMVGMRVRTYRQDVGTRTLTRGERCKTRKNERESKGEKVFNKGISEEERARRKKGIE